MKQTIWLSKNDLHRSFDFGNGIRDLELVYGCPIKMNRSALDLVKNLFTPEQFHLRWMRLHGRHESQEALDSINNFNHWIGLEIDLRFCNNLEGFLSNF